MSDAGVEQTSLFSKKADMTNDVEKMEADCTDHTVTTDATDSAKSNGLPADGAGDNKQSVDVKTKTEQKTVEESKCKTDKSAEEKESSDDNVEATKSPTKRKSKAVEKEADSSPKKKSKKETTDVPDEDVKKSAKTSKADEKEETKEEKKNLKQKADKKKEESSDDEDEGSEEDDDDEITEAKQPGLLERPVVLEEGCKREKKKVQRLEVTPVHNERKSLSIVDGSGTKLGDIPRIELQLQKFHGEDLKPLHRFLYDRVEKTTIVKRNIRQFSGFTFSKSSTEFNKKKEKLTKFTSPLLKMVCEVLDLERKGKKEEIIDRIMDFLMKPESSGKPLPKPSQKRRRSSSAKKSSPKSKDGEKKPRKKKEKKDAEAAGSDDSGSESEKEADDDKDEKAAEKSESEKEAASSDDESDEPAKKKKKSTPAKKAPKPKAAKKTPKAESKKPAKKTAGKKKAKAESSSDDSSEDEPLEKKKKGPPTDGVLKDVIKKILKTANLEEVTMKTVCKQVYDKYPEFDLTSRKDFIKATVKQILK